jgi:putative tryptophan/tyrosine transport system substrate-binding protein
MQFRQLRRREFVTLLGGMAVAWPLPLSAQHPSPMRRIGVLMGIAENDADAKPRAMAFQQGLEELGWTKGRNIRIEYRWAAADPEHMHAYAAELVALAPDLILANTTPVVAALQLATRTIPIVFVNVVDPIGPGFVDSLARPGGNITGFLIFEFSMGGKWLETLKEVAPRDKRVAIIFNPQTAPFGESFVRVVEAAAPTFAVETVSAMVHDNAELESAVASFAGKPDGSLIVLPDIFTTSHRDTIVALAARNRLPAIYPFRYFAASGGLVSDGVDGTDLFRRSASYVDRILKGEKPADLPVQAPTKYELVINLKTAKALGLSIPPTLLATADGVIE